MTKVEELRELRDALDDLIETEATKILTAHQFLELPGFDKIMDAIVAAAHAEGVVEGAERLQEYTARYLAEGIKRCDAALAQGRREGAEKEREKWAGRACEYREGCLAFKTYFSTDASVLAPTKEKT